MNIRSLSPSKLDDLLDVARDRRVDVLLLCETWHDTASVSICRLRASSSEHGRGHGKLKLHSASTMTALLLSPLLVSA